MRRGKSVSVLPTDRCTAPTSYQRPRRCAETRLSAEIVLFTADEAGTNEIMRRTGKSKTCVSRWQERFMEEGFEGLLRDRHAALAYQTARGRGCRARRRLDAQRSAWRDDPLDRRLDGESIGSQRQFRPTNLARPWSPAAPDSPVQALERPALRRQIARRGRTLCRSASACDRLVCRRKEPDFRRSTAPSPACR